MWTLLAMLATLFAATSLSAVATDAAPCTQTSLSAAVSDWTLCATASLPDAAADEESLIQLRNVSLAPEALQAATATPDYQYFCKHNLQDQSHYIECRWCHGEPICCDANLAATTDNPYGGGKRCTETKYGAVDIEKCAARPVPDACPYEYHCKRDASEKSYYWNCENACADTPICCNKDTTTLDSDLDYSETGGSRCMEGYPGHAKFSMCQRRALPTTCPDDYSYFCSMESSTKSHYVGCSTCIGEPICCNVSEAASTTVPESGGKRCTETNYGVAGMSRCATKDVPATCNYQWFCKHDPSKSSYYRNCDTCVDTPICCNMDDITLETDFPDDVTGGKRCKVGADGYVDFSMCDQDALPSTCRPFVP